MTPKTAIVLAGVVLLIGGVWNLWRRKFGVAFILLLAGVSIMAADAPGQEKIGQ